MRRNRGGFYWGLWWPLYFGRKLKSLLRARVRVAGIKIPGISGILKLRNWYHWVLYDTAVVPESGQAFPEKYKFFGTGDGSKIGGNGVDGAVEKTRLDTDMPSSGMFARGWEMLVFSIGLSFTGDEETLGSRLDLVDKGILRFTIGEKDYHVGFLKHYAHPRRSQRYYIQHLFQIPVPILPGDLFTIELSFDENPVQPPASHAYEIRVWLEGIVRRPTQWIRRKWKRKRKQRKGLRLVSKSVVKSRRLVVPKRPAANRTRPKGSK